MTVGVGGRTNHDLADLVEASHRAVPDDVPGLIVEYARVLGAVDAVLYLVDYEQRVLVPVPGRDGQRRDELVIDSTLAGRAYRTLDIQSGTGPDGGMRAWVPVLDGVERLGALELVSTADPPGLDLEAARVFARLIADVVLTKQAYGDLFERVRRRKPLSVAAELAWRLLPPLTFGTDEIVITGVVAPVYELGGDSFDYNVDKTCARVAVFDAMGHGLEAGLLASVAMAACRTSRRSGADIAATAAAIDRAVSGQFGADRFVTALIAELEVGSGALTWTVSGHPPPLLLRGGRIVKVLAGQVTPPLGVSGAVVVSEEKLEPGDQVLFFTDGVTEARSADGELFGVERLVDMVAKTSAAGAPPPETLRRLMHAILDHQEGELQDDATIVVLEWRGAGPDRLEPGPPGA